MNISVTDQDNVSNVPVLTDTNWVRMDDSASLRVQIPPEHCVCEALTYLHTIISVFGSNTLVFCCNVCFLCHSGLSVWAAASTGNHKPECCGSDPAGGS